MANSSYTAAITRTLAKHGTEIFDAVSTNNALLWLLKQAGNIKVSSGGRVFTHPIIYGTNSSFQMRTKYQTISTPDPDILTRAEYSQKIADGSIVLSWLEEAQNTGKEALIKLAAEKKQEAIISMGELLGDQVFNDGSVAEDFGGLQQLIHILPATQGAVGGITTSSYTYWQNKTETTATAAFNTSSAGLKIMDTLLLDCTFGRLGPKVIITTKAIWSLYQVGQAANIRYAHANLADAGFRSLDYAGLPILFDDNCPAGRMYMIDTDSLWLQVLKGGNNQLTDFKASSNQLTDVALMYLFGNMTCGSRRTQGVATGITG